jgi:hypothetical protein
MKVMGAAVLVWSFVTAATPLFSGSLTHLMCARFILGVAGKFDIEQFPQLSPPPPSHSFPLIYHVP